MTDEINKVVAAVAAPITKRKYKQREVIYETKFSFTDENLARVKYRKLSHDRRYDEKIPGLSILLMIILSIGLINSKKNNFQKLT